MSTQNKIDTVAVTHFVRESLGCGCPDEVFRTIKVTRGSSSIKSFPAEYELAVGGRLLIVILSVHNREQAAFSAKLETLIKEGKQARDAGSFNRFRFVVVSDNSKEADVLRANLSRQFEQIATRDDKTHLHVIPQSELPALFAS